MRVLALIVWLLPLLAGCAGGPPWARPYDSFGPGAIANPMFVSHPDPDYVWESLVDVIDDEFRIEHEEPVRVLGGVITEGRLETYPQPASTLLEPWRRDSASRFDKLDATLQSMRCHLSARVIPAQGGYWIEIAAFKELEDLPCPAHASAGAATFRYDGGLTRVVNPVDEQETTRGWIPQGRDTALEQYLLEHLQARFAGQGVPRGTPIQEYRGGAVTPREGPTAHLVTYRAQSPAPRPTAKIETPLSPIAASPPPDPAGSPDFLLPSYRSRPPPSLLADPESPWPTLANGQMSGQDAPEFDRLGARLFHAPAVQEFLTDVSFDYYHFYNCSGLFSIGMTVGSGAVLANTAMDQHFQDWYQQDVRSSVTDSLSSFGRYEGNGKYTIPAVLAATLLASRFDGPLANDVSEWGKRCVRSYLVGGPLVLGLQYGLGASRPGETSAGSHWKPFTDSNSVSGHAFVGAVPFLAAAQMTDAWVLKFPLYAMSTWSAWSRVNDNKHYLSQAAMGWCFAYLATSAVDETETRRKTFIVTPVVMPEGPGVGLVWKM